MGTYRTARRGLWTCVVVGFVLQNGLGIPARAADTAAKAEGNYVFIFDPRDVQDYLRERMLRRIAVAVHRSDMRERVPDAAASRGESEVADHQPLFQHIQEELARDPAPARRAELLRDMAVLYEDIGDLREALRLAREAAALSNDAGILAMERRLERQLHPPDTVVESLRKRHRRHGLSFDTALGVEHDSNVILEAVNPTRPTDKADAARVLNFSAMKSWGRKPGRPSLESFYGYYRSDYFRFEELDSASHTVSQNLLWERASAGGPLNLVGRLNATHFESAGHRLLWNWGLAPGVFYFQERRRILWSGGAGYRSTTYYSGAFASQEGEAFDMNLSATRFLAEGRREIGLAIEAQREDPQGANLRYWQEAAILQGKLRFAAPWKPELRPRLRYHQRDYDAAAPGRPLRADRQTSLALGLAWSSPGRHSLEIKGAVLENRSSDSANHYRKGTFGITYGLRL